MNDFSKKTIAALARKGITLVGLTVIPDNSKPLPFASGERGYFINDNGCHRVMSFMQVIGEAK